MTTHKEALKLALEALTVAANMAAVHNDSELEYGFQCTARELENAFKEALAQQSNEQVEPVTFKPPAKWRDDEIANGYRGIRWVAADGVYGRPTQEDVEQYLGYTHPPVPTAQPKEPEQEPVGFVVDLYNGANTPSLPPTATVAWLNDNPKIGQVLYTTPPQRKPLTDEQIDAAIKNSKKVDTGYAGWVRDQRREFGRAIEVAHGIKGDA